MKQTLTLQTVCLFIFFNILCGHLVFGQPYTVSGQVYVDHDANVIKDGLDYGHPIITVRAFDDVDNSGDYSAGDIDIASDISDENGNYSITGIIPPGAEYLVGIDPSDLASGANITNGPFTLVGTGATNLDLSFQGENVVCYAVADMTNFSNSNKDFLVVINRESGVNEYVGSSGTNSINMEAIAFNKGATTLFGIDGDNLGKINLITGAFTPLSNTIGAGNNPSSGILVYSDCDGMAFDPFTGKLYASVRSNTDGVKDALIIIDTVTGQAISEAFGAGTDYVVIDGVGLKEDIDDLAIDPTNGQLYGISNDNGEEDVLVSIDKTTGNSSVVGVLTYLGSNLNDVEGFGFTNSGILIATTGDEAVVTANSMFIVNLATGVCSLIGTFTVLGTDYEACECLTQKENRLSGTVFFDDDISLDQGPGELGVANALMNIYIDSDGSGTFSAGDIFVDSIRTDGTGFYDWTTSSNLDFVITVDPTSLVIGGLTYGITDGPFEQGPFDGGFGGQIDPQNNFGLAIGSFPVEWLEFNASLDGNDGIVKWITASEENNDYFEIERSIDGFRFAPIESLGIVEAGGTTQSPTSYEFRDEAIHKLGVPTVYYRIKQVDFDGSFGYSSTLSLRLNYKGDIYLNTFPNPNSTPWTNLVVGAPKGSDLSLKVLDMNGRLIMQDHIRSNGQPQTLTLYTKAWAPGMYIIQVDNSVDQTFRKLIIE